MVNVLMLGDVSGASGMGALFLGLPQLKKRENVDFVIVNGENAAQGFGISIQDYDNMMKMGVDVITSGNHIWQKEEIFQILEKSDSILRPLNYPEGVVGKGWTIKNGIAVVNAEGRYGGLPLIDDPFQRVKEVVLKLRKDANSEMKFDAFFRASAHALGFALRNLAHMIDGPFFSTFAEKIYTFSYVNDLDPAEAVQRALGATVFPTDPAYGKLIVTVSSGFGTAQLEQIFHTVVSNTGIIPDIVKRDDREDTKVLVFLPVRLTSPRASRS